MKSLTPAVKVPRAIRIAALGVNAWAVTILVPTFHIGLGSALQTASAVLPLGVLGWGLAVLSRPARARWPLLAGFPASLGLVVATREAFVREEAFDPTAIGVSVLSLIAFLVGAAMSLTGPTDTKASTVHPLSGKEPVIEPRRRRWLRRLVLTSSAVGALAIALVAPTDERAGFRVAWGNAADQGAVLTVLVGCAVAAVALAMIIGPGLRADRGPRVAPARTRRHLALMLLLGAASLVGWLVLRRFDALS